MSHVILPGILVIVGLFCVVLLARRAKRERFSRGNQQARVGFNAAQNALNSSQMAAQQGARAARQASFQAAQNAMRSSQMAAQQAARAAQQASLHH
jgi:hypothetical protein